MGNLGLSPSQAFWTMMLGSFPVLYLTVRQLPAIWLPEIVTNHPVLSCFFTAIVLAYTDRLIVWPFFRSPLNGLPTLTSSRDLTSLVFESPRGQTVLKWIAQYPDVDILHVRTIIGYSVLIPITPDGFRDLMGAATYHVEKPYGIRQSLSYVLGWGLVVTEGEEHKRQRKALTPAFSLNNIRGLYGLMWRKADEFSMHVKAEADKNGYVEISSWASKLTLDIIGHAALSQDFKTMSEPDNELLTSFKYILETDTTRQLHFILNLFLPQWFLGRLPLAFIKEEEYHCRAIRRRCEEMLAEKKKTMEKLSSQAHETDMLRDIVVSDAFKDSEVIDQMMTFLAAGHETTAGALTWCCYLMTQNPDTQTKLFEELQANLPSDANSVDCNTFDKLPYLNGVCEEVLRLYPSVPASLREVTSDTVMCGVSVPRETAIVIAAWAVNRNPKFWGPDAEECRPERWIDTAADGSQKSNKHGGSDNNLCGMTFLHGNRSCIGRDFAKAELKCAIANLFSKFEVSMWKPEEKIRSIGTVTTKPDVGMKVKLRSR